VLKKLMSNIYENTNNSVVGESKAKESTGLSCQGSK
jgi:hypothetical protein